MLKYLVGIIIAALLSLCSCSSDQERAFEMLDRMQTPENCTGAKYTVVDMGCGGGFAAHFQLAASEWLKVTRHFDFKIPVLIIGHIRGYTYGKECENVNKGTIQNRLPIFLGYFHRMSDWTCFFLPMSSCQETLLATGIRVPPGWHTINESVVPTEFQHRGLSWWWGIIQARMFRLQPAVQEYITLQSKHMDDGKGFPYGFPVAGLHVRHGDKSSDGFRLHSFEAEMVVIRKSPECLVTPLGVCKNADDPSSTVSADPNEGTATGKELRIFVASDNGAVLEAAKKLGHLVDSSGISQQTGEGGMFKYLLSHPELGYNASLEIIADIHFLAHCSTLVGIAASQVFRMAVGISNATGTLKHVTAMDYNQLPRIQQMSAKYDLPLPETFAPP